MKNTFFIILLFIISNILAQDIIKTKDGRKIEAKEINISSTIISYKLFNSMDNVIHSIPSKKVLKITYENGKSEMFAGINPRKANPFGINIVAGGPTIVLSLSTNYFITPCINLETGLGLIGYYLAILR